MVDEAEEVTVESLQQQIDELKRKNRETRRTVIDVAQKYAQQHNLCSVVDQALQEAGMFGPSVRKTIKINIPVEVTAEIDAELLDGLDEEEQKAALAEMAKVSGITWERNFGRTTSVANGVRRTLDAAHRIGDIEVVEVADPPTIQQAAAGGNHADWANPPQGFLALYSYPQGRKVHFVRVYDDYYGRQQANVDIGGVTFNVHRRPLCNAPVNDAIYGGGGGYWMLTSPRAQHVGNTAGICQDCRTAAAHGYAWSFNATGGRARTNTRRMR